MRRWTLRIATTAALLIGVVPFQSKALTVGECYTIVERDYALCNSGPYNSFGQCENRRAERLVACSQGKFLPLNGSPKDQCLERARAEFQRCGGTNRCMNGYIQGMQQCR